MSSSLIDELQLDAAGKALMGWTPPDGIGCAKVEVLKTPLEGGVRGGG